MSTLTIVTKSTGLAKSASTVRDLAARLERARQVRNERLARADADYLEAVRRAAAEAVETPAANEPDAPPDAAPAVTATA